MVRGVVDQDRAVAGDRHPARKGQRRRLGGTAIAVDAESGVVIQLRPRAQLEAGAVVSHTKPIGFRAERTFPESTGVGIDLTQIYALSARSTIGFPIRPRYYFVSPGPDWMTLALGAGYRRQLDSITTIDALAGLQLAKVDGQSTSVFPRARLGYEHILFQRADTTVANRLQAYLDASLDPAIGDVRPTFGVMAELRSYFANDWMTEVSLTGDTTTTSSRPDGISCRRRSSSLSAMTGSSLSAGTTTVTSGGGSGRAGTGPCRAPRRPAASRISSG